LPRLRATVLCLFCLTLGALPAAAQSVVAVPIHSFVFAGTPDVALARLRAAAARCWSDDYHSRVLGMYREVAEVPASASGGATVRLEWQRVVNDRPAGLLKRAFDIALRPEGGATRVTVLAYGPNREVGRDIEGWLAGNPKCFAGRYPSP
jgi:hypothetical protein